MFHKLSLLLLLTVVLPLSHTLQITTPTNVASQSPVTITWTTDPSDSIFSMELVKTEFHDSFAIANNVDPSKGSLTVNLPPVPPGDGYTLQAVNVTDITKVYATSGSFSISQASSTTASASGSGTASASKASSTAPSTTSSSAASATPSKNAAATVASGGMFEMMSVVGGVIAVSWGFV